VRGVVAFDIKSRVGFRVAKPLRFGQALGKSHIVALHPRQDVVAGAVEDSVDALIELPVSDSRITLITGMPPATAASKLSSTPLLSAKPRKFHTMRASIALLAVTT
jgi:hypothetical protein